MLSAKNKRGINHSNFERNSQNSWELSMQLVEIRGSTMFIAMNIAGVKAGDKIHQTHLPSTQFLL